MPPSTGWEHKYGTTCFRAGDPGNTKLLLVVMVEKERVGAEPCKHDISMVLIPAC